MAISNDMLKQRTPRSFAISLGFMAARGRAVWALVSPVVFCNGPEPKMADTIQVGEICTGLL